MTRSLLALLLLGAAGCVAGPRSTLILEAEVFDLMSRWIERYARQAEERFARLDALLQYMPDDPDPNAPPQQGDRT